MKSRERSRVPSTTGTPTVSLTFGAGAGDAARRVNRAWPDRRASPPRRARVSRARPRSGRPPQFGIMRLMGDRVMGVASNAGTAALVRALWNAAHGQHSAVQLAL